MIRPLYTIAAPLLLVVACGSPAAYDVERPCASHDDCPDGYCEHGYCAVGELPDDLADVADIEDRDVDDRRPDLSETDDSGDGDTDDDRDVLDDAPGGGEVGSLCLDDSYCDTGRCLWTNGDRTCVSPCDEGCPEGSVCAVARGERGEPLRSCVHVAYVDCVDEDHDGFGVGEMCLGDDCDDALATVNVEAEEICDDVDNDCDGEVDEEVTFVNDCGGCRILEGSPGGACGHCDTGTYACEGAEALVCEGETDAVGSNACGGCGPLELEPGDPCGACGDGEVVCADTETVICEGSRPPPPELCDGVDNDCDGEIDEDNPEGGLACETGELGGCAEGSMTCVDAGFVCLPLTPAEAERCDGVDNDCDGLTDEDVLGTYFQDSDGDGAGNPNVVLRACSAPPGYVLDGTDCNDARNDIIAGECTPGETRSSSCGNCGTQTETCSLACMWAVSTGCTGQGVCTPGAFDFTGCMECQATECNALCEWGDPPPEPGTVSSTDNDGICEACFCDTYTTCGGDCRADFHTSSRRNASSCSRLNYCAPNCGYTFTTCDDACPTGYYNYAVGSSSTCAYSGNAYYRGCRMIADDNRIQVCDGECPPGFTRTGSGTSSSCGVSGSGGYVECSR